MKITLADVTVEIPNADPDNITSRGGRCILCTLWLSTGEDGSAMMGDVFS